MMTKPANHEGLCDIFLSGKKGYRASSGEFVYDRKSISNPQKMMKGQVIV